MRSVCLNVYANFSLPATSVSAYPPCTITFSFMLALAAQGAGHVVAIETIVD